MPGVSRKTATESVQMLGFDVRLSNLDGGYTVCFETHSEDQDLGPLFMGLPDDACQFERFGYVVGGTAEFRVAGRTETYSAGEAYYVPAGHVPVQHAGADIVEFSRTAPLGEAVGALMANVQRGRRPKPVERAR